MGDTSAFHWAGSMPPTGAVELFSTPDNAMTRAFRSPKAPLTVGCGRSQGKTAFHSRRYRFDDLAMRKSFQLRSASDTPNFA